MWLVGNWRTYNVNTSPQILSKQVIHRLEVEHTQTRSLNWAAFNCASRRHNFAVRFLENGRLYSGQTFATERTCSHWLKPTVTLEAKWVVFVSYPKSVTLQSQLRGTPNANWQQQKHILGLTPRCECGPRQRHAVYVAKIHTPVTERNKTVRFDPPLTPALQISIGQHYLINLNWRLPKWQKSAKSWRS